MEGWVRVRVAGHVDWKRFWMVVTAGPSDTASVTSNNGTPNAPRKRRMSALFSSSNAPKDAPRASLVLFAGPKPKDRKKALLSVSGVKQAFAVYPERPELISRSTLMKLEGSIGQEEEAGMMKGKEGWLLVMPELEGGNTQASEMLKWLIGECFNSVPSS
jgi:CCR4-NOT transcriptional complex subunit CAF120